MNYHHVHHNQALEWMSSSSTNHPSSSTTTTTTKIEVVEEEELDTKASSSSVASTTVVIEREHMFDKVVTPSDVGKLNRLVIPKQHAEKYFPLDSSSNEKGLLLNFEDRTGKAWRFRYSYWNSSQSYVMTKGWSRFVKEKKLDAGDIVSFQRGVGDKDRLFIDWRRRPDVSTFHLPNHHHSQILYHHQSQSQSQNQLQHGRVAASWTSHGAPAFVLRSHPYAQAQAQSPYGPPPPSVWDPQAGPTGLLRRGMGAGAGHYGYGIGNVVNHPAYPVTGSLVFVRSGGGGGSTVATAAQNVASPSSASTRVQRVGEGGEENMVYESVPVVQGKAAAKRLRLFGVNMECPISHQTHDFDILSSSLASSSANNNNNNNNNNANTNHSHPHHHYHLQQQQQQQHDQHLQQHQHQQQSPINSMGPPSSPSQHHNTSHHDLAHPNFQLRSFFNGTTTSTSSLPPPKGKSSTSSSSMSLDLDI